MFDDLRSAMIMSGAGVARDTDIFLRVMGFDGRPGESLRIVGDRHKLSAERVRQISDRVGESLRSQVETGEHYEVVRDKINEIMEIISRMVPETDEAITLELLSRRLISGDRRMASSAVSIAHQLFGHGEISVVKWGGRSVLLDRDTPRCYLNVASLARKIAASSGAVSVQSVMAAYEQVHSVTLPEAVVRTMLECCATFLYCHDDLWFHFPESESDVVARAESHVGSLGSCFIPALVEARHRVTRSHYNIKLPIEVMIAVLKQHGFVIDGDYARLEKASPRKLPEIQMQMVQVMRDLGGRAKCADYVRACVKQGINSSTARVYLSRSGLFHFDEGHYLVAIQ